MIIGLEGRKVVGKIEKSLRREQEYRATYGSTLDSFTGSVADFANGISDASKKS
jgi:hypothetical protein